MVPDKIFGLTPILDFIDHGHSLYSLHPPPAAVVSLPLWSSWKVREPYERFLVDLCILSLQRESMVALIHRSLASLEQFADPAAQAFPLRGILRTHLLNPLSRGGLGFFQGF